MKIMVIGLDCAAPELLLGDERLTNIRSLMAAGMYGRLESVVPPITVPAWMCMSTSQDPGSLGVYGFRNRSAYGYRDLAIANSKSIREIALWDQVAREGRRSVIIGVPPGYPPRKVNGISVGCFLTPDPSTTVYTHPASIADDIAQLVGEYPVDVKNFRTDRKDWLRDEIYTMTRKHFDVIRHFIKHSEWDYFQFVEIGLDRLHHGFWKFHDPEHRRHEPGNPYESVIRDYYLYLDQEIGRVLEMLDSETVVAVVSDHGAQRLDGGFCINEWLIRQGLLVLNDYPRQVTPFDRLSVNWSKTTAWSEGGYYARIFMNVKGREPEGTIDPSDYERVRDDLTARLEATEDEIGEPLGTVVFKPEAVYRTVRNIAPDLIVHFGGLYWRSIGGVGYPTIHVEENDTGPDDCNHAQFGSMVIAAPEGSAVGEIQDMRLLDVAPTLLELAGYDIPSSMQGKSLATLLATTASTSTPNRADEETVRRRLSGLGYI